MTRHIIDHATTEGTGMRQFLEIERREGRHPAVQGLSQRDSDSSGRKMQEFLRIDRAEKATSSD